MGVLMSLGQAAEEALAEFPGKTAAEVATAAHSAYTAMSTLRLPAPAPQPKASARAQKRKKTVSKLAKSDDKAVSIMEVLRKAKKPLAASEIAEKTGLPGQGLGPTLNRMHGEGVLTKKEAENGFVWGAKPLNGKAVSAPN